MEDIQRLVALLQYAQSQTKIYHWNTRVFSQHIALDELYETLAKYTDMVAEASIGLEPGALEGIEQTSFALPVDNVLDYITELVDLVKEYSQPVAAMSGALQSTLDDMMQEILTAKYKLEQFR